MFVQYYTHVPIPLGLVEERIEEVRSRLEEWAGAAYREGEDLFATVGPGHGAYAKKVKLDIGTAEIRRGGLVYPITWSAVGATGLFPKLTADLVLTHVGPARTKLSLRGTYDPPLGVVGRAIDRALLTKIAESTIQEWVDQVAEAVAPIDRVRSEG